MKKCCCHCENELEQGDEIYMVEDGFVHVDCFRDYAWQKIVGNSSFNYDEVEI